MRTPAHHLRLVAPSATGDRASIPSRGDFALLATLFAMNLVPIAGELAHPGRWGAGTVGLAAAGALLTGRELASQVRTLLRARVTS